MSHRGPQDVKTPSGGDAPGAKEGNTGQAYFKKLLQSKQFKDTKKRASQRMAQEQAQKIVDKVQSQMDESKPGAAASTAQKVEEEGSSSASDNDDQAPEDGQPPAENDGSAPAQ